MSNKKRILWDPLISSAENVSQDKLISDIESLGYIVIKVIPGVIQEELTDDENNPSGSAWRRQRNAV